MSEEQNLQQKCKPPIKILNSNGLLVLPQELSKSQHWWCRLHRECRGLHPCYCWRELHQHRAQKPVGPHLLFSMFILPCTPFLWISPTNINKVALTRLLPNNQMWEKNLSIRCRELSYTMEPLKKMLFTYFKHTALQWYLVSIHSECKCTPKLGWECVHN